MSGKFDFKKLFKDNDKKRFFGTVIIIAVAAVMFALGFTTGKDLLPGGSGGSDAETSVSVVTTTAPSSTESVTEEVLRGTTSAETTAKTTTKKSATTAKKTTTTAKTTTAEPVQSVAEYKFRTKSQLTQHFDKHGSEFAKDFGYKTAEEYEKGASAVINDPRALHKTEKEDGDHVYYIEETNEFVILSTDGYIRTYFRPSAGKAYYDRQ